MSRSYRNIRSHDAKVYSVAEVEELYDVCRNTVSNWRVAGLKPSDACSPQVFRGAELNRFHADRAERTRKELRLGEFKCVGCCNAVFPEIWTVSLQTNEGRPSTAHATCCDCDAVVMKLLGATERDKIQECLDTNTPLAFIDEGKVTPPVDIGKNPGSRDSEWFTINDRLIHDWQAYAGRYSDKTIQAHLVSIRDFESFQDGVHFGKVMPKQVGEYRDHLVRLLELPKEQGGLSNSTVRHRASHLKSFFEWLRGQDGYKRLSSNIPAYLALPRRASALSTKEKPTEYPTLDEAWCMVELMPRRKIIQRRDRAMVAFAFASGLRAAALTALRIKHVDFDRKTVLQDAKDVPAKNGKTYRARWFPRTEAFQEVFRSWAQELRDLGFRPQDALFPPEGSLSALGTDAAAIGPLNSSKVVQAAFASASGLIGRSYTPHSARHTLKALGAKLCPSEELRKGWSMNLGHSKLQTTENYYGKMTPARSCEIIEALCSDQVFTEEENETIIDFYQHRFQRGTAEYLAAKELAERRDKARGDCGVIE